MKYIHLIHWRQISILFFIVFICHANTKANDLYIGTFTTDITPALPVALDGQLHLRIAQKVETPLEANIIVLESRQGARSTESVIFVTCDLVAIPDELLANVRNKVHQIKPEIDVSKIIMNAIHTHTAPVIRKGLYSIPDSITQIEDYYTFFTNQVGDAIVKAWDKRSPGSVTWGLSHAKIGHNRRAVYADNSAQMYGKTNVPEFRTIEGPEDQKINTLFFWDQNEKLLAMSINVACPAQEAEHRYAVNADYWHPVRVTLREQYGAGLCVSGWIGAAGDQSPHLMYGSAAEERMLKLRNLDPLDEIARRVVDAVEDAYKVVANDKQKDVALVHEMKKISLPMRVVTDQEYKQSKVQFEKIQAQIDADPALKDRLFRPRKMEADVIRRYEEQKNIARPMYETEIHVIRIGDIAVCSNPFELYTDFGIAIQSRSKAIQTFIIQLSGAAAYLPTEKAVRGGSYSALVQSNLVGPEGGQELVEKTVSLINSLWQETEK